MLLLFGVSTAKFTIHFLCTLKFDVMNDETKSRFEAPMRPFRRLYLFSSILNSQWVNKCTRFRILFVQHFASIGKLFNRFVRATQTASGKFICSLSSTGVCCHFVFFFLYSATQCAVVCSFVGNEICCAHARLAARRLHTWTWPTLIISILLYIVRYHLDATAN